MSEEQVACDAWQLESWNRVRARSQQVLVGRWDSARFLMHRAPLIAAGDTLALGKQDAREQSPTAA